MTILPNLMKILRGVFKKPSIYFAFTFLRLGVKVFLLAFDFLFPPLNNKIFDGKFPEISKQCSQNYMHSNFKRKTQGIISCWHSSSTLVLFIEKQYHPFS